MKLMWDQNGAPNWRKPKMLCALDILAVVNCSFLMKIILMKVLFFTFGHDSPLFLII